MVGGLVGRRWASVLLWSVLLAGAVGASTLGTSSGTAAAPVTWSQGRPLSWSDFRGPAPADAASRCEAATIFMTFSWRATYTVSYDARSRQWLAAVDAATLSVTNTMDPSQSWVLASAQRADLLRHEQRHFDLNEVYRRQLVTVLSGLRAGASTESSAEEALRAAIDSTSSRILGQAREAQSRYDAETAHGADAKRQADWDALIASWLSGSSAPISGQVPSSASRSSP